MKQKFYYPKGVYDVKLSSSSERFYLTGLDNYLNNGEGVKHWHFDLPPGTWYISEQNFQEGWLILWNGLEDIPDKFEYFYKKLTVESNDKVIVYLNELGKEGWELVNYECLGDSPKKMSFDNVYMLIFKRKLKQ